MSEPQTNRFPLLRKAVIADLQELQLSLDIEAAHSDADRMLCELLRAMGFADVVREYNKIRKWYA